MMALKFNLRGAGLSMTTAGDQSWRAMSMKFHLLVVVKIRESVRLKKVHPLGNRNGIGRVNADLPVRQWDIVGIVVAC